jgi:agmatine deiminase
MPPTPRELGYRMPAEWEPHEGTWLAWPRNRADWPGRFAPIPWVYGEIVRRLSRVERVHIIAANRDEEEAARRILKKCGAVMEAVNLFHAPTDRVWTRDYGPIFVRQASGKIAITNWHFNGWAKYDNWRKDNAIPARVTKQLKLREWQPGLVLEGGSIDVNGAGLLLTTEECLLSIVQQRNPGLSQGDLELVFEDYLGIEKVIWLGKGIAGDDTHGHVDDIARFVAPDTVVTAVEANRSDANYVPLKDNLKRLRAATDLKGRKLQVVELPLPRPVIFRGQRLPASYANFYIANNLVLVPTFNDPKDHTALNILTGLFPKREIVGIHCGDFIWGLGAIHCMTQQQPAE